MKIRPPSELPATETFLFDGCRIPITRGDTFASALAAAGVLRLRANRDGEARGLHCGMGACFDCLVVVDGRQGVRACLEKARSGAVVSSGVRSVDELGPLASMTSKPEVMEAEVAVIGAGPAGSVLACELAEAGVDVLVLDERLSSGGQYFKPIAAAGPREPAVDRQARDGAKLADRLLRSGARVMTGATVWLAADNGREIGIFHDGRSCVLHPRITVLATGATERPYPVPGWTLPGVMTTGGLQSLIRAHRTVPGNRIVIAGSGPLNFQAACELLRLGVRPVAVVEEAPRPSLRTASAAVGMLTSDPRTTLTGLGYLARLAVAGVPIYWSGRVTRISGSGTVDAVDISTPAGNKRAAADIVAINAGFTPQAELARQLGCRLSYVDAHVGALAVETDEWGRTSVDTVYAIGDGARVAGARVAVAQATLTALGILKELRRTMSADAGAVRRKLARAKRFQDALWQVFRQTPFEAAAIPGETVVCRCESVTCDSVRAACRSVEPSLATVKRLTRAGMGRCQGRFCAGTLTRIVAAEDGGQPDVRAFFAPRPPAKPVPLIAVAFEKAEWSGHKRAVPPAVSPRATRTLPSFDQIDVDVCVIGAGIVGSCVAYEASRAGRSVTIVDRHEANAQASGANAGSLHIQLLSFDFGAKSKHGGGPAEVLRIAPAAIGLWREIEAASGEDLEIRTPGGLMVAESDSDVAFLEQKVALERSFGVESTLIGGNELRRLEPHLSTSLACASRCEGEGKINPLRATHAVMRMAREAGAQFESFASVVAVERANGKWLVRTERGTVRASAVVNCAGGWASRIASMAGRPIPVAGAPLQMIVTEPAPQMVTHLIAHASRHLSLKQAAAGGLIIGGAWTATLDEKTGAATVERPSIEGNSWVACHVLPAAAALRIVRVWSAMNIDIDGAPIVGEMPGAPGFYNCVTSNGYSLAPIVARMTVDLITRGRSDYPAELYSLARFG